MSVTFHLPGYLSAFAGGRGKLEVEGDFADVGEALAALGRAHPGVRDRVLSEDGRVRPHVNVFVGRESIRHSGGLATPVGDATEIYIIPAVSGG